VDWPVAPTIMESNDLKKDLIDISIFSDIMHRSTNCLAIERRYVAKNKWIAAGMPGTKFSSSELSESGQNLTCEQ
jgi:hypothetical protein